MMISCGCLLKQQLQLHFETHWGATLLASLQSVCSPFSHTSAVHSPIADLRMAHESRDRQAVLERNDVHRFQEFKSGTFQSSSQILTKHCLTAGVRLLIPCRQLEFMIPFIGINLSIRDTPEAHEKRCG